MKKSRTLPSLTWKWCKHNTAAQAAKSIRLEIRKFYSFNNIIHLLSSRIHYHYYVGSKKGLYLIKIFVYQVFINQNYTISYKYWLYLNEFTSIQNNFWLPHVLLLEWVLRTEEEFINRPELHAQNWKWNFCTRWLCKWCAIF